MKRKKMFYIIIFTIIFIISFFSIDTIKCLNNYSSYKKFIVLDSNNNEIASIEKNNIIDNLKAEEIPEIVIKSFLTIEDKRFYGHSGFDIYRTCKALINNIFDDSVSGGSTITQQYVKNAYYSINKSYTRKLKELITSIQIEGRYSKEYILEKYFNSLYFGNNIYGLKSASKYYYNKNINELNINEIAVLIAIINAPSHVNPNKNVDLVIERKNIVLKKLLNNNIITKITYEKNINEVPKFTLSNNTNSPLCYFLDLVIEELNKIDYKLGLEENLIIYTDYDEQLNNTLNKYKEIDPEYSLIAINNMNQITAIMGGKKYDYSKYNRALKSKRDIASTIKPLLYYEALQNGLKTDTMFLSERTKFVSDSNSFIISNYNEKYENKAISMGYALASSNNIYAMKTHLTIGMDKLVNGLAIFGIDANAIPSLALGSIGLTLMELVNIYSTFMNDGLYKNIKCIKKIELNNKIIYENNSQYIRKLDGKNTFIIRDIMTWMFDTNLSNIESVTGSRIANNINVKLAGKSGLSDYDSYMIGFNPTGLIAVRVGYDEKKLLKQSDQQLAKTIFIDAIKSSNYITDSWYKTPNDIKYKFIYPIEGVNKTKLTPL